MKHFQTTSRLLGFAFALGIALGTPTPIWAGEIPSPRLMIRSGSLRGSTKREARSAKRENGETPCLFPASCFVLRAPSCAKREARAVIPSALELKDGALPGCAIVHARTWWRQP